MSMASSSLEVKTSLSHMPSARSAQLLLVFPGPLSPAACCLLSASQLLLGALLTCFASLPACLQSGHQVAASPLQCQLWLLGWELISAKNCLPYALEGVMLTMSVKNSWNHVKIVRTKTTTTKKTTCDFQDVLVWKIIIFSMVLSSALQLRKCPRKIPLFWPVPKTAIYLRSSGLHSFYNWDHPSHPITPWDTCVQLACAKFLIAPTTLDAFTISVTEKPFSPLNTSDMIDILPFWIKPVLYFFTCNQNFKPDTFLTKYLCPTGPKLSSSSHTCQNF